MLRSRFALSVALSSLLVPIRVDALTVSQFQLLCTTKESCSDDPVIQAYVGGALDLFATINEESKTVKSMKCSLEDELYNVNKVVEYMKTQKASPNENAMTLFLNYFEVHGKCKL